MNTELHSNGLPQIVTGNPLNLGGYFADPEPYQWSDGRMYLYCSHDFYPDSWCCGDYHVLSSDDLVHWVDHGISLHASQLPPGSPHLLYACDCAYKDGLYYLYFTTPQGILTVAASESPVGPFLNPVQVPGFAGIDPAVFVDDDGQGYLYWGQFDNVRVAKLKPSMMQIEEESIVQPLSVADHNFHEGSAMVKRDGIYYYVYADTSRHGETPTCLGYATGPTPMGPFTYRGVIIDNHGCDPGVWNNHGRVAQFNGDWYVFYHRSTHGGKFLRQTCAERIQFNEDGRIDEVQMTSHGVLGPIPARARINASAACLVSGAVHSDNDAGGLCLGAISNGDYALYRDFDFGDCVTRFEMEVSNSGAPTEIELRLDGPHGDIIGKCAIANTRGEWQEIAVGVRGVTGVHPLCLLFAGSRALSTSACIRSFGFA